MNWNHPTQEQLSFYYDGILDRDERHILDTHLQTCEPCRTILQSFALFDSALEMDLSEAEIDRLLSHTVQDVHTRIIENERRLRVRTEPFWGWLLAPRNILGGLALLLLVCGLVTTLNTEQIRSWFVGNSKPEPTIIYEQDVFSKAEPISTEQRQGILLAARFAKSTVSTGIEYAKGKTNKIEETLSSLKAEAGKAIALATLPTPQSPTQPESATGEPKPKTPVETLKQVGRQQIQLGVGASILGLLSVF